MKTVSVKSMLQIILLIVKDFRAFLEGRDDSFDKLRWTFDNIILMAKKDELHIWSLQIFCFPRMLARNCMLVFLKQHHLTQHG